MSKKPRRWWTPIAFILGVVLGVAGTLCAIVSGIYLPTSPETQEWGAFPTSARVELLDDGRQLKLMEDFVYIDPQERVWVANKDTVVDGASIPQAFWSITGGPLEGQYRKASIVHDEACKRRTELSDDVHLMFYNACRCAKVPEYKAKLLFAAVYHFGPRWELKPIHESRTKLGPDGKERVYKTTRMISGNLSARKPTSGDRKKLEKFIKSKNPSLAELKKMNPTAL